MSSRRITSIVLSFLCSGLVVSGAASAVQPAEFLVLPRLGQGYETEAMNVSADGQTVVGHSGLEGSGDWEAFVWNSNDGIRGLGDFPGGYYRSSATAVSADGAVVVGWGSLEVGQEAFRWTAPEGLIPLGRLLDIGMSSAYDVSADGRVIVGTASHPELYRAGVVWSDGLLTDFGYEGIQSIQAVSADGQTFAGVGVASVFGTWESGFEGFIREPDGTIWAFGDLLGRSPSGVASGLSADGRVGVGRGHWIFGGEAIHWDRRNGLQRYSPRVAGQRQSWARDISADGGVAVGTVIAVGPMAAIFDPFRGARLVKEVLQSDYGIDMSEWFLIDATGVSDDGLTIVGIGSRLGGPKFAWRVNLPPACDDGLDNDGDGATDFPQDPGCRSASDNWEPFRSGAVIDVTPTWPNDVLPIHRRSPVSVALLGTEDLDVGTVDAATLGLGPAAAPAIQTGRLAPQVRDVDGDGLPDLIAFFQLSETGLQNGDHEVCLQGDTNLETFRACDEVRVVGQRR